MVRVRRCEEGHTTRDLAALVCVCGGSLLDGPFDEEDTDVNQSQFVALVLDFPWGPAEVGRSCQLGRSAKFCDFADRIAERDPNSYVGREHAVISLRSGEILVEDMGSRNQTTVDGRPVPSGKAVTAPSGAKVVLAGVLEIGVRGR